MIIHNGPGGKSHTKLYSLLSVTFFTFMFSAIVFAIPPTNPSEQSIPVQLRLIRVALDNLSVQIIDTEGRLTDKLTTLQASSDALQGSTDTLQTSVDDLQVTTGDIYNEVTAVNIEMTTQVCFDAAAKFEATVGIHDEVGIGWPNVLSAKAILQGEGGFGGELGVSNQICIHVPLYSVESYDQLLTNGGEFDDLIAAIALPSQAVVPVIAEVYTALMPTPDESLEAMNNVLVAATGYDIYTGVTGTPNPVELLRPDLLLDPIIPQVAKDFVTYAPTAIAAALLDPCGTLEATPLGAALKDRQDVEFLCNAHAGALSGLVTTVNVVNNLILDILDPFNAPH